MAALAWPASHAGTALIVRDETGPPDAIIMLASHEWERLPAAAALARQHPAAIVLLTVPDVVSIHNCHRCGERVEWLEAEGVSRERIKVLRAQPGNTYGEALAARRRAVSVPFSRLTIVTSPYHTRRALAAFRTVFRGMSIQVNSVPAEPARGDPARWWTDAYDRYYVVYEWAAILNYRLEYKVPVSSPGVGQP